MPRAVYLGLRAAACAVLALLWTGAVARAQRQPRIADVQVSPPDAQIQVGQRYPFLATAYDAVGNPIATATFEWTSSNPTVVSIGADGVALGVSSGIAIITVRTGRGSAAKSAQAPVQVSAPLEPRAVTAAPVAAPAPSPAAPPPAEVPAVQQQRAVSPAVPPASPVGLAAMSRQPAGSGEPDALVLRPATSVLVPGERRQLEYRFVRADGASAEPQPVVFSVDSSAQRIARVDSLGLVVAGPEAGSAVVRAAHPGNRRFAAEVAMEVRADTVRFREPAVELVVGMSDTLGLAVPAQARELPLDARVFTLASSDTAAVFVRPQAPIIEARGPGRAVITAESPQYRYRIAATVVVRRPVTAFSADPADTLVLLGIGQSRTIGARPLGADSTPLPDVPLVWTAPDSLIARFDTAANAVHGVRRGETRLLVSARGAGGAPVVRAWRIRVVAPGVAVAAPRLGIGLGETTSVAVQLRDARGQVLGPLSDVAWTSSADSVVRVSGGRIVGVGIGRARLTARAPWDSTATVDAYVVGDLAVVAQRGRQWDLYATRVDDPGALVPITQDAAVETAVAWSPDRTRLAYVARPVARARTADLYLVDIDGAQLRRLTNDSAVVSSPWFVPPSGDRVVYASTRGGRSQVYVINADGTGRRGLTGGDAASSSPTVSPDGQRVAFVSERGGNADIYEMNLDGTGERRLTTSPRDEDLPRYALGGRLLFFVREEGVRARRLYRLDTASGQEAQVTPPGLSVETYSVNPSALGPALALHLSVLDRVPVPITFALVREGGMLGPVPLRRGELVAASVFRPARQAAAPPR